MSTTMREGGCQCGAIRYRATGEPVLSALCHCTMCRRANAAPAVAWAMYAEDRVSFEGTPHRYASSPEGTRGFCAHCGSQICFTADFLPGMIDLTIGSMDRPEELPIVLHYWDAHRLPWLQTADALPRHAGFPPMGD
jgi:hypothetical protein